MPNQPPLRLHLTPNQVRVDPRIENGELALSFRGMQLSAHGDAMEIHGPSEDMPVTVEFLDFRDEHDTQWTVTAMHDGTQWARSGDRCSFQWNQIDEEVRVDVTASANGISKAKPVFLRVPPEGDKPYP